jgi:hypothetical protein
MKEQHPLPKAGELWARNFAVACAAHQQLWLFEESLQSRVEARVIIFGVDGRGSCRTYITRSGAQYYIERGRLWRVA